MFLQTETMNETKRVEWKLFLSTEMTLLILTKKMKTLFSHLVAEVAWLETFCKQYCGDGIAQRHDLVIHYSVSN